jgi:hypothetical protein
MKKDMGYFFNVRKATIFSHLKGLKMINRLKCIMCKGALKDIYTFKNFPIYMGVSEELSEKDIFEDMVFSVCEDCGVLQLKNMVDLDVLYSKPHNSAVGDSWMNHHKKFFEFIKKFAKGSLVEIGGGDLRLSHFLSSVEAVQKITVYEKNFYAQPSSKKIRLERRFFDADLVSFRVDAIIHSHVFEHFYDPMVELKKMSGLLDNGGYMIMAVPLIDKLLMDNFTNALNFEHTYMTSFETIEFMLNSNQFEIEASFSFSKYITFIAAKKNSLTKIKNEMVLCLGESIFKEFVKFHLDFVKRVDKEIGKGSEKVYIFGAHIFTQYLFGFGLDENLFESVLDNDINKIGRRLFGTTLKVESPNVLKDIKKPIIVLRAAQYTDEIKENILKNINNEAVFIL